MIEIEKPNIECVAKSDDNTYVNMLLNPWKRAMAQHWGTL